MSCVLMSLTKSIHVIDGVMVTSFSARLLQNISAAMYHLCQIALNRKLLHKFENWCKYTSCIEAKSCKTRPASVQVCTA